MENFKSLTSELGQMFAIGIKIGSIVCLGFLIYGIIENVYDAILFSILAILFLYITLLRKMFSFKKIEYSTEAIKISDEKYSFNNIIDFKLGYIILKDDPSKNNYYNYFYSQNRFKELKRLLSKQ
ncbi:hypothetical protein [Mesonia sp. K7]|uniref:hypothetical protein n=1 Tax=Mesonia sp. K7 TaxID=2218606 RepID=UPI000DA73A00|nr:hypothetical protein [Mesonia sp. K7]PZD78786.1 hypothetical protein DNG35_04860 [Mesonia sp. K7]